MNSARVNAIASIASFWAVSSYLFVLCIMNSSLPNGEHLLIASELREPQGIGSLFLHKRLSRIHEYFTERSCEIEFYKNHQRQLTHQEKPAPLVAGLLAVYAGIDSSTKKDNDGYIEARVLEAINQCDVEAALVNYPVQPIFLAIQSSQPAFVEALIERGVRLDSRIDRPGKTTDGMNPLSYARLVLTKMPSSNAKRTLDILKEASNER